MKSPAGRPDGVSSPPRLPARLLQRLRGPRPPEPDPADFRERLSADLAGATTVALACLGDRLGLFRALADGHARTPAQLTTATGLVGRYVEEWCKALACAGWLEHRAGRFRLPPAHAAALVDEAGPDFAGAQPEMTMAILARLDDVERAFREGGGVPYAAYGERWVAALRRSTRTAVQHALVQRWLPAVPGLVERLRAGARVVDVGCGAGDAVARIAEAFPASICIGIDADPHSVEVARDAVAGLPNATVALGDVENLHEFGALHLVTTFDVIHDLPAPDAALVAIRDALAVDGVYLWADILAGDTVEDNTGVAGALYYGFSVLHCMTVSLARGGAGLGTVLGPARIREMAAAAGFSSCERIDPENTYSLLHALRR